MSEPILITLSKTDDFDGTTLITLTRDQFTSTPATGPRVYNATLTGPAGLLRGDFFGYFGASTLKLVGVAGPSRNPQDVVRVLDSAGRIRRQLSITPELRYVIVAPGDNLAVSTRDGVVTGGLQVTFLVNELTESDHIIGALERGIVPYTEQRRFRISRSLGSPFVNSLASPNWNPVFVYNPVTGLLATSDNTNGPIPVANLSLTVPTQPVFVSIRYGNPIAAGGNFFVVEGGNRTARAVDTLLTVAKWSQIARLSHDDLISLDCAENAVGGTLSCDIDVINVVGEERVASYAAFKRVFT